MKPSPLFLLLVLGLFALLGTGCVMTTDGYEQPTRSSSHRSATFLTLVDESLQLTPEQMEERRRNIISYLVSEGYIYSGEDLVQSASFADQIVRAKLALDGSFELTIYRPEHIARREIAFDPAGDPAYEYFPGDIGYMGDGIAPYFIPLAPYFASRRGGDHSRDQHSHETKPTDHQPPRDAANDGKDRHPMPPGNRPAGTGDQHNNRNRPSDTPPVSGQSQPKAPHHDPRDDDHHQPSSAPGQPEVRHAHPELQQPANSSHNPTPPDSGKSRNQPDNPAPRQSPSPRSTPEPARDNSTRTVAPSTQTDTQKKSDTSSGQDSSADQRHR